MSSAVLLSIFTGLPKTYGMEDAQNPYDRKWTTSFYKEPVNGPVRLGKLGLDGDKPADTRYHGGEQQAVLVYSADRYPRWHREHNLPNLIQPCFGENFSVQGIDEDSVCIGDIYQVGKARVQVSQPRQPCSKLVKRNRIESLVQLVVDTGWSGWYLRVIEEADVQPGDVMELLERPYPQWTVQRVGRIRHFRKEHSAEARELSRCEALSPEWRKILG